MSQLRTQFGHLVHFVHTLSGQEVQAVQIFVVRREEHLMVGLLDTDDGLEDGTFAVLNPLSHGMKVGGKIYGSRENTFLILSFRFSVQLFPPFVQVVQLRLVVYQNFYFLAFGI